MFTITYYEVGQTYPTAECFDTFEEAVQRADEVSNADIITDMETYTEYSRCEWCGEWVDTEETDADGYCERCIQAIKSRGEEI